MKDPYSIKEQIKDYFHFSKSEQRGILILIVLIVFFFLMPKAYKAFFYKETVVDFSEFEAEINAFEAGKARIRDSLDAKYGKGKKASSPFPERREDEVKPKSDPFPFDPNTASFEVLCQVGLPQKAARILIKYREKGGSFRTPIDLKKVYGLSESDFRRLEPFVAIAKKEGSKKEKPFVKKEQPVPGNLEPAETGNEDKYWDTKKNNQYTDNQPKASFIVKVNQSTAEEWQRLYGIGPAYAKRIVKFRDALGGFYSIDQISEVYGLPDSTFQAIKPFLALEILNEKPLDINTANAESLKKHPYLSWKQANAIVNYRKQHGPFTSLEAFGKMVAIDQDTYSRLLPYVHIDTIPGKGN